MRAVVVRSPGPADSLEAVELPDPSPGPDELTVEVAYAGVGFVDTLFRSGAFGLPTPFTPGIEVTGHVREVGPGVAGFRPGQPVAALLNDFGRGMRAGGYAEVAVAHAAMTTRLPDGADLARVAAVLVNGVTAWLALRDLARLDVRDDVLVLGASGGLGGITGRLAAIHPARRVIAVAASPGKRLSDATWTDVVHGADLGSAVRELTDGRGVDVVIDPVGGELRTRAYDQLAPFGRLVMLGNASGRDTAIPGDSLWLGTRQVLGLSLGGVAHLIPRRVGAALTALVDLVHRGVLREPAPAILPLDRVAEVHRALEDRTAPAKTVLAVR
ncbi:quinone oxidoreductase family protein [Streptomyces litchfieldiae]|uniref:Zinc-binding dehydrogenase n=1 Tax=Streptomyces litchfieldiae TaxID=3075543 RepID=A0ABU2MUJ3_9ACTN|nr:zinc-binding dehydrogenase [Streptomyces sp. DSM 44938]MDT0345072.1 zinc-binding dehydrogenase [Streptomyces sp. DSM 44938]